MMNRMVRQISSQFAVMVLASTAALAALPPQATVPASPAPPPTRYAINATTLASFSGVHPKLYVDNAQLSQLQSSYANPAAGSRWKFLRETFDSKVNGYRSKNPAPAGYDNGNLAENWQEINGEAMFNEAVAFRLTNNAAYLEDALRWARASISYKTWGKDKQGREEYDLTAADELHGMAVLYDWCYSTLKMKYPRDFDAIQRTLIARAQGMYEAASGTNPKATTPQWWAGEWEQNHLWISEVGLQTAALALYGDPRAPGKSTITTWLQDGMNRFNNLLLYRGTDGADLEGVNYWRFGMSWTFRYFDFAQKLLGVNFWRDPWTQQTGRYRLWFSTAANSWYNTNLHTTTDYIDFADAERNDGASYIFRKLASVYHDPLMQWAAWNMDSAGGGAHSLIDNSPRDPALNLIWYDSTVPEQSPSTASLPLSHVFSDLDFVVSRSDWSGKESVLAFQSGPPMGFAVLHSPQTFDSRSAPHPHPAANNFCIFGDGEWLLRNDGYTRKKATGQTNTLLVGGSGQLGQQTPIYDWFNMELARHSEAHIDTSVSNSQKAFDYYVGEASGTYDASLGVQKYRRRLIYVRPDVLIVLDTIALRNAKPLELRFFPEQQTAAGSGDQYTTVGSSSKLLFQLLSTSSSSVSTKNVPMLKEFGEPMSRLAFSVSPKGGSAKNWENASAFSWSAKTGTPATVSEDNSDAKKWKFVITRGTTSKTVTIDKATEAVSLF